MEMESQHQIGVLNSYISFQLIDHLAELYEKNDDCAKGLIQSFAERKKWGAEDVMARLNNKQATLSLLAGMIFFIKTSNLLLSEEGEHKWCEHITLVSKNRKVTDVRIRAIQIIRNAIAHWG